MRRKTDRDILKEHKWLIIGSALVIVFGLFIAIAPHILPGVRYDSLHTKEVIVTQFGHFYGGVGWAAYDYIRTTDGEEYHISGVYQRERLKTQLVGGKSITIKWYQNKPFWTLFAEEIYVDGERVVTYDNDVPANWKLPLFLGACFVAFGVSGFFMIRFFLRTNRMKQRKRDEKIKRKYGNGTK